MARFRIAHLKPFTPLKIECPILSAYFLYQVIKAGVPGSHSEAAPARQILSQRRRPPFILAGHKALTNLNTRKKIYHLILLYLITRIVKKSSGENGASTINVAGILNRSMKTLCLMPALYAGNVFQQRAISKIKHQASNHAPWEDRNQEDYWGGLQAFKVAELQEEEPCCGSPLAGRCTDSVWLLHVCSQPRPTQTGRTPTGRRSTRLKLHPQIITSPHFYKIINARVCQTNQQKCMHARVGKQLIK